MKDKTGKSQEEDESKPKKEYVIVTKQDELWVFVKNYLEMLQYSTAKIDAGFASRFEQLLDYVYSKIELPANGGDVLDSCHFVWQKIIDGE